MINIKNFNKNKIIIKALILHTRIATHAQDIINSHIKTSNSFNLTNSNISLFSIRKSLSKPKPSKTILNRTLKREPLILAVIIILIAIPSNIKTLRNLQLMDLTIQKM